MEALDEGLLEIFPQQIDDIDDLYKAVIHATQKHSLKGFGETEGKARTINSYIQCIKGEFEQEAYINIRNVVFEILDEMSYVFSVAGLFEKRHNIEESDLIYLNFDTGSIPEQAWKSWKRWIEIVEKLKEYAIEQDDIRLINNIIIRFIQECEDKLKDNSPVFLGKEQEMGEKLRILFQYINDVRPQVEERCGRQWRWNTVKIYKIEHYTSTKENEG